MRRHFVASLNHLVQWCPLCGIIEIILSEESIILRSVVLEIESYRCEVCQYKKHILVVLTCDVGWNRLCSVGPSKVFCVCVYNIHMSMYTYYNYMSAELLFALSFVPSKAGARPNPT